MKKIIKVLILLFSFTITLLYIGPLITTGDHSIGVLLGLGFAFLLFVYFVRFDKANSVIKTIWSKKAGKILISIASILACVSIIVGSVTFANIVKYSEKTEKTTEYAILLGCKVNGDKPGVFLNQRINTAVNFLVENPNSKIILSGGQGNNENISEAQCMYNELLAKGISADRMIIEDWSTNTEENFKNSKDLMSKHGVDIDELTVITNDFHEYRASQFAIKQGITTYPYPCKTVWNGYMPFATREFIAVIFQIYLGLHR